MTKTKICTRTDCVHKGRAQSVANFHARKKSPDGLHPTCKDCRRKDSVAGWEQAKKNPAVLKRMAEYRARPEVKRRLKTWFQSEEGRRHILVSHARERAKKLGLPCDITADDVVIPKVCPLLGIPLCHNKSCGPRDSSPTVDRIIPALGYTKSNILIISHKANTIKSNATVAEIELLVRNLKAIQTFRRSHA